MSKTDKELAVELVLAQIHASSIVKMNQLQTGQIIKSDTICNKIEQYYTKLQSLDDK